MNYFPFHIGDYVSATSHLSWEEDLAYLRLLQAYYRLETPLPVAKRELYRLVRATEERQREAVDTVLEEFFELRHDGWHNNRADEEIAKAQLKKEKAKQSAAVRWQDRPHTDRNANASPTHANASPSPANAMPTQCEGNAPNPNPNPNNRIGEVVARDPGFELERKLRVAAGWQNEPSPKLAVTGPIQALLDAGADLELDVLPVIKAIAPQAEGRSWNYFVKAIARARDQRIEAATVISMPTPSSRKPANGPYQRKPTRAEAFAAIDRRIEQLAEAERREAAGGSPSPFEPDEGAS